MKAFLFLGVFVFLAMFFKTSSLALPKEGVSRLTSSNGEYTLRLADVSEPWTYKLQILHHGTELASYSFEGELVSAYWSPSLKFVAIDNHDGHGGIVVWLVSLKDGSIITAHGTVRGGNYDRYSDSDNFPDLRQIAGASLRSVYPGAGDDQLRNGYSSVAYGWKGDHQLMMFHQFPYDYLSEKENCLIQAYSTWAVTDHSVRLKSIAFKKVKAMPDEPMPREVYRTLNFMN